MPPPALSSSTSSATSSSRRPPPMALSLPLPSHAAPAPPPAAPDGAAHDGDAAEPAPHDPSHPWAALFGPSRRAPPASAAAPSDTSPAPPTPGHLDTHISSLTILPGGAENGQRVAQAGGFFAPSAAPAPVPSASPAPAPSASPAPPPISVPTVPQLDPTSKQAGQPVKPPCPLPVPSVGGAVAGGMRLTIPISARMSRGASLPVPLPMSKSPSNSQSLDPAEQAFRAQIAALSPAELLQSCQPRPESSVVAPTEDVLILDIRPANAFRSVRLRGSINVCAPSTLLKRRSVTVDQVGDELLGDGGGDLFSDPHTQFGRWRRSCPLVRNKADLAPGPRIRRILVLDASTSSLSDAGRPGMGGGGTCIAGLLRKFYDQEFEGELAFLAGGFAALSALPEAEQLLVRTSPLFGKGLGPLTSLTPNETDNAAAQSNATADPLAGPHFKGGQRAMSFSLSLPTHKANDWRQLQARDGPTPGPMTNPWQAPPLTGPLALPPRSKGLVQPGALPSEAFTTLSTVHGARDAPQEPRCAPATGLTTTAANPFFDNIRQNRELANGITEVVPLALPTLSDGERQRLPRFLQEFVISPTDAGACAERDRKLAHDFYDIDRQEQVRLNATLARLSETVADPRNAEQGKAIPLPNRDVDDCWFPFSIAAALERGEDNRYSNIWPYEHTRVRLREPRKEGDPGSDYINASFAAPALQWGSERRYIATQAPLPATFDAFWTSVWEQGVKVLVMLAKEREAGRTQAHAYWDEPHRGTVHTHIVEQVALDAHGAALPERAAEGAAGGGGFFSAQDAGQNDEGPVFIRRVFRLNLASRPSEVRYVVQVQYLAWPDYFVPDSPDSLLNLIEMVDTLQNSAWGAGPSLPLTPRPTSPSPLGDDSAPNSSSPALSSSTFASTGLGASEAQSPMLVHCSAGVGRTGAFIVIDSLLDALRRARRQGAALTPLRTWDCDSIPSPSAGLSDTDEPPEQVCVLPLPPETVSQPPGRERQRKRGRSASGQMTEEVAAEPGSSPLSASSSGGGKPTSRRTRTRPKPATSPPPNPVRNMPRRPSATSMVSISSSSSLASRTDETARRRYMDRAKWETAAEVLLGTNDLVKKATETLREQRMSSVQTTRQYVFVHQALLAGALRDMRRHPSSSAAAIKALASLATGTSTSSTGPGDETNASHVSPTVSSSPISSPAAAPGAAGAGMRIPAPVRQRSNMGANLSPTLAQQVQAHLPPPFAPGQPNMPSQTH